jgi:hypothetical protein
MEFPIKTTRFSSFLREESSIFASLNSLKLGQSCAKEEVVIKKE